MKIKHTFQSAKSDGGDVTLVRPSDWNAEHAVEGIGDVRQTVLSAGVDSNGIANFLSAGTGLAVNLSATATPLRLLFASGFDSGGGVDYIGSVTSDVSPAWSSLTANKTLYLYIDRNPSTGLLTYGFSELSPKYQYTAPSSPSVDQHWFNPASFIMKRYTGTTWEEKQRVFIGECITDASSVTSVITYALRDMATVTATPTWALSSAYVMNHNLGCPSHADAYFECLAANNGYSVGDLFHISSEAATGSGYGSKYAVDRLQFRVLTGGTYIAYLLPKAGGTPFSINSSWGIRAFIKRVF